jgi:uncharacterized protein YbgA (DUF1722 family)/uncharacterized protein YbbK (DUF523 family)
MTRTPRIRIGISSCLLGQAVRYDGDHKLDSYVRDTLGRYFEFVPLCPEVAIGLGVPRPPIRLVGDPEAPRAVGVEDPDMDVTRKLDAYGRRMGRAHDGLSGYIFKSKSPSCGLERVQVFGGHGAPRRGRGLYAAAFLAEQPLLPAEEEGRLGDPDLRASFIERVFAYRRWQDLEAQGVTAARLIAFHSDHQLALLAHDPAACRSLGRMVAALGKGRARAVAPGYLAAFMEALARPATRARHANVLRHLAGYLKRTLDAGDKAELAELIGQYRSGRLPLIVPVTLLRHHLRRTGTCECRERQDAGSGRHAGTCECRERQDAGSGRHAGTCECRERQDAGSGRHAGTGRRDGGMGPPGARLHPCGYIARQTYLYPHPHEWTLRYDV